MKKLLISLAFLLVFQVSTAQTPVPIPDSYLSPQAANLCQQNSGFGINSLDLAPIGPPSVFTLSLQIYVVTSTTPVVPPYPTNWPPYPDCYPSSSGNHPVMLENGSISECSLVLGQQPTFNAATKTFDWEIEMCPSNVIEQIRYDVFLDCSFYSLLNNASGSLYLIQKWSYNGNLFPTQPPPVPITFPFLSAPNVQNVNANTGFTEVWNFDYQNTGTGPAEISFIFNIDQCSGEYNLTAHNPEYSYDNGLTWTSFVLGSLVSSNQLIPTGDFLKIRQMVFIQGCAADCGPISLPPPVSPKYAHFNWRCHRPPPNNYCLSCYQSDYLTELHFVTEQPKFELTRISPSASDALHNNLACQGQSTTWEIQVKNTSFFTTLPDIIVELDNPILTSLSLVDYNNVAISQNCASPCAASVLSRDIMTVIPDEILSCTSNVPIPIDNFKIQILNLKPGEIVRFTFEEFHCCSEDESLLNAMKYFNQWQISAIATTACGTSVTPDPGATDNAIIAGANGISGHNTTPLVDVDLALLFANPINSTVVSSPLTPQSPYYKSTPENYEIDILSMFGNLDDAQSFGYSVGPPSTSISGIFKVEIDIEDEGLLMANPYDAFFEFTDPATLNKIEWHHNSYFNFPCSSSSYTLGGGPCFHDGTNPVACSDSLKYCLYFDSADLPSGFDLAQAFSPSGQLLSKFKYSLYACCSSDPQTNFKVKFNVFKNRDNCSIGSISDCDPTECFLPLSSIEGHTIVHCPGCKHPGIIANSYRIERSTLGYPDDLNDRFADNTSTPIIYTTGQEINPYLKYDNIAWYRSTFGDQLVDYSISNFTDGDVSSGGYTYCNLKNQGIDLDHLQFYRDFENSGTGIGGYDVQVTGFDLYIDDPSYIGPTIGCLDCIKFYTSVVTNPTVFQLSVDATSPVFSTFFDRLPFPADDSKMLFTFSETELTNIISNISSLPAGVSATINNSGITSIDFNVGQIYRLRTRYTVCGNQHVPQDIVDPNDLKSDSDIGEFVYLTGAPKNLGFILTPGNAPIDLRPKNTINELENAGFKFNVGNSPCILPVSGCTTCSFISPANFGDIFYFFCEPTEGQHQFIATDLITRANYSSLFAEENCNYSITAYVTNSLARTSQESTIQFFPYEFKPLNLFPSTISISPPPGWVIDINSGTASVEIGSKRIDNAYTNNTFQLPATLGQVTVDFGLSPLNSVTCFDQLTPFPASGLYQGDEYQVQKVKVPCRPDDTCPVTNSDGSANDVTSHFEENVTNCQPAITTCAFNQDQANLSSFPNPFRFYAPNPNLSCTIWPANYNALTHIVSWNFSFQNPSAGISPTLGIGTTPVTNPFLLVPDLSGSGNYLQNWKVDYTIEGNYPYGYSPLKTSTFTITNPAQGGYFWFTPQGTGTSNEFKYLPVGGQIYNGTISAEYSPCTQPADFDFVWGWNCNQTTDPINSVDLCGEVNSVHVVINKDALLVPQVAASQPIPSDYTACDGQLDLKACFTSAAPADLKPSKCNITNLGNVVLLPGFNISACGGISTYSINGAGDITVANTIPNATDYMHTSDCFCIEFTVEPQCNVGDLQLPTVEIEWENYCGDLETTTFDLPSIPNNTSDPSLCTDCFEVTKIPLLTNTIASGTEPVTFEIKVCGNNDPLLNPDPAIDLWDVFPQGFSAIGANPFGTGGNLTAITAIPLSGTDCATYFVTGTITSANTPVCNSAYIGNASSNTVANQDAACLNIVPNCISASTDFIVSNQKATTAFNCGLSPCVVSNKNIDVSGTLTIDDDFVFISCVFKMEPGSEIIVDPNKLITISSCDFTACSKMWRGITLRNSAQLSTRHSYFYGAQYAINVGDRNIVTIDDGEFASNYIGVFVRDLNAPPHIFNTSSIWISGSNFYGNGVMPDYYQGQSNYQGIVTLPGNIPYAGILANRTSQLFLGHDPNSFAPNRFSYMSNGIVGKRSNLIKIINCQFTDIMPDNSYTGASYTGFGANYNGSAIYGSGNKTIWAINQAGFGLSINDPYTFKNCKYGVFADRISLISHNNKMEEMTIGYRAQVVKTGISIFENIIDSWNDGIQMLQCDNNNVENSIIGNRITFGDNDLSASYAGINVQENKIQNLLSRIHDNAINFRTNSPSARYGIFTSSTFGVEVTRNTINFGDNALEWDGIHSSDCNSNVISCNSITGIGPLPAIKSDQSAIKYTMGDGPIIACNYMNNSPNGLFIIGQVGTQNNLVVTGNEFNGHFYGLRYGTNTLCSPQDKQGNLWPANPPPLGFQAINENPNLNVGIDFYLVHLTNPAPPLTHTYYPVFWANGQNWFQPTASGQNESCDVPVPDYYCDSYYPARLAELTDLDRGVAENSIENDPYTFESNWMLKKALFSKLTDHPQLLTDSLMAEYYANLQNSLIDQIVEVEKSKEVLFNKDSGEVSTMEHSLVSFISLIDQLDNQLVQLHDANVSGLSNQTVLQNIQSIQNDLFSLIEVSDNLNTQHDSLRVILASDIEFENNQLPTTEIIESNERIVNEIYLNTIGQDNFSFAPDQVIALRSIANQCPLSGGSAVFRARGLLFIAFGELYYNDREICNMEGIELKQTQSGDLNHTQVTIKPNPSNELTSVTYDFSEESSIDYNLYSSTGSRIDHKELVGGKQTFSIPTSKLLPGVYFISLTGANGQNFKGKLVVIR